MRGPGLRILVWCPRVNLGGGSRLLSRLVPAMADHPSVDLVRVVTPEAWPGLTRPREGNSAPIEHFWLREPAWKPWLARDGRIAWIKGTGYLKRLLRPLLLRRRGVEVAALLRAAVRDCDVVYVFWPHFMNFPTIDRPVVCTMQDVTFLEFPEVAGGEAEAEWLRVEGWLNGADRVVVSSQATRQSLTRLFGDDHRAVAVVPHAISPVDLDECGSEAPALLRSLPSAYVVYPANTTAHKNHFNLLVAWSRFARRREFPLVLCGEGTADLSRRGPGWPAHAPSARLAGAIARFGLERGADFFNLGYVSDAEVASLVRNATALIMPSQAEGGGSYPVEEALALGVPVLCSDIPVMREHLSTRSAKVAWFDPYSPDSIVRALDGFFDNYPEFKESALRGAGDVRPTWKEIGAAYAEILLEAAGRSDGRDVRR